MTTASRVIKNTGFLYAKMGITMFISLYTTRLILNALGASDFGIYNVVGGAIAMLGFLHAAMSSATQRFMSYYEGKGDREKQKYIFNVSTVLHVLIALLLVIILVIAGYFFFHGILNIPSDRVNAAKVIYASLILSTAFTVISVPYEAVLNAHENMLYYSIVGVIESLLKLTVALIIVYYAGDKLILYGILMAIIPFISRTIMQVYCHRKYEECVIAPRKYWEKALMKEMTSFAGWSFLGTASTMITGYGQGIVLNIFFGTTINAAQGIANQISGQLGVFGTSIKKALNPVIAKSAGANDKHLMIKSTVLGTKIIYFVVTICFLPFIIEMPYILKLWLKKPPEFAIVFCNLLLITNMINDLVLFLPQAISAIGNIKNYQIFTSSLGFLTLGLSFIAFKFGAEPYFIYIIAGIVNIFSNIITMYFADKLCNIPFVYYLKNVIIRSVLPFLLVLSCALIIKTFLSESIIRLAVLFLFSLSTYTIAFFFIGLDKEEKKESALKIKEIKTKFKNGKR